MRMVVAKVWCGNSKDCRGRLCLGDHAQLWPELVQHVVLGEHNTLGDLADAVGAIGNRVSADR